VLWVSYWCVQGCVCTGLWVIAHECGHGGFSDSERVNDVVGWIVHSALLVPFFSWKISHRRHHSNTNSLLRDEVFVPLVAKHVQSTVNSDKLTVATKTSTWGVEQQKIIDEDSTLMATKAAMVRMLSITAMLVLGWPLYLLFNATGRDYPKGGWISHFNPNSPIFGDKERHLIVISDIGLLITLTALYSFARAYSVAWVVYVYVVPYLIVNLFLVLITFLQHTDESVPHYADGEWDWLRGALATVDRDYGILNTVFHHIGDTHVVHHLFFSMPHYRAQEATEAVKKVLGNYYMQDSTPIAVALWRSFGSCNLVEPESQKRKAVMWFTQ